MLRTRSFLAASAIALLSQTGCLWLQEYDSAFISREDVELEAPGSDGFRAGGERGDVYEISAEAAQNVNAWVGETVEAVATVVRALNHQPPNGFDYNWRVYGPYKDDQGRDLSWVIKIEGDEESSTYEVLLGRRSARDASDMDLLIAGHIAVDGAERSGGFSIDFDTIERYGSLKDPADRDTVYAGDIEVSFLRNVDTQLKHVDLDFKDFVVDAPDEDAYLSDENYSFHREDDGSGTFHLGVWSTFESEDWSGPEQERMALDLVWNADEAGRARGTIVEADGEGDLRHGDIVIHECFDDQGILSWREIGEAYAAELPEYNLGDPESCIFSEDDLS